MIVLGLTIPEDMRNVIFPSRLDTNRFQVQPGHADFKPGIYDAQQVLDMIHAHQAKQQAVYRAATNERRQSEAAARKAYRASVNAQVQAMWPLLDLQDGARATVTLGDTSIEVAREGANLVCNL